MCRWARGKDLEQLRFPCALWTRDTVRELVGLEWGDQTGRIDGGQPLP